MMEKRAPFVWVGLPARCNAADRAYTTPQTRWL